MSIVVVATIYPKPEEHAAVTALLEDGIATVHADDDGCELYALHDGPDGTLVFVEKWRDADAIKAHGAGPGLTGVLKGLEGKTTKDMDVVMLTPHPAGQAGLGTV